MKAIPKWLMIPPAVALLLVLGPLTMQGGTLAQGDGNAAPNGATVPQPTTTSTPGNAASEPPFATGELMPALPDMYQITSALAGVLLLGGLAVYLLRRLRNGGVGTGSQRNRLITLRQSLRLGQRQALHAVEFDDRILLIGEGERGLTMLQNSALPEALDEADATARAAALLAGRIVDSAVGDEPADYGNAPGDDGATPKDLVIPRPERAPSTTARASAGPVNGRRGGGGVTPNLQDFRALLQKAGR